MELVTYRMTGQSPILMNNPASMANGSTTAKKPKSPKHEDEAEQKVYRNSDGHLHIPACAFRASLLSSSSGRKFGKLTARVVFAASVLCPEEWTVLLDPDTDKPLTEYDVDVRRVVNKSTGGAVLRARPRIEKWCCLVVFEVDFEFLPNIEALTSQLNVAGKIVGVMDFRVEKKGQFGIYTAKLEA